MEKRKKGFLYSLIGVFLVSTNFITAKYGLSQFNPESFCVIWTTASSFYSFLICLFFKESRKEVFTLRHIRPLTAIGISTGITMIFGWKGLSLLDPTFTSFLWRMFPVAVILAGVIFLKEKLKKEEIAAIGIMLFGSIYSVQGRWNIVGKGVLFISFAILFCTLQFILAKIYIDRIHPNVMVAYRAAIAAIFVTLWGLFSGKLMFNAEPRYWLVTLLGAFLGPCASFLFTFRAYRYWELSRASMLLILQPIIVLPMAYVFLGTIPEKEELIGGFIILAGAFWLGIIQLRK